MNETKLSTIDDPPTKYDTNADQSRLEVTLTDNKGTAGDVRHYEVGTFLGKYLIKSFLGQGGMGVVYRGFDPLVERDVALKVLPPGLSSSQSALQRFISEARAVGKLNYPNATALYEIGQVDGAYFLAMEFVSGGSVASLLNEQRLPAERATRYLIEVCLGLAAAHEVGLVHRDIKPENLLRTMQDHVKITDFGLAKVSDALSGSTLSLTNPGSLLGTPLYMSPEQFNGSRVDWSTDIYSAGATYFHMLTGTAPYAESKTVVQLMYAHCQRPVPDPRELVPEIPEGCVQIIKRAMAKLPEDRYATASDMALAATSLLTVLQAESSSRSVVGHVENSAVASADMAPPKSIGSMTVWVLEPSRMQAMVLQQRLKSLGVTQLMMFSTIAETISALQSEVPHVIISAMHLDDGSGDDLATQLQANPNATSVACFLVSSNAAEIGPGSYYPGRPLVLPKPLTKEMLADALNRLLVH